MAFLAMQRVEVTCSHCGKTDTRLASAVKKGSTLTCAHCRKRFRAKELRVLVGTAGR